MIIKNPLIVIQGGGGGTTASFADDSWDVINHIAQAGLASEKYKVGDEKTITLEGGEQVTLQILGFDHDDLTTTDTYIVPSSTPLTSGWLAETDGGTALTPAIDKFYKVKTAGDYENKVYKWDAIGNTYVLILGDKAKMTIGMKNLLATTYKMNDTDTNVGGWGGYDEATANVCKMRTTTMPEYYNKLPADLRGVIKTVDKKTTAGNMLTDIKISHDNLFLFSRVEVFPNITQEGYVGEGTQYEYWNKHNTNADRIKKLSNGTSSASWWWLRSPFIGYASYFGGISGGGGDSDGGASSVGGVCFGFCI